MSKWASPSRNRQALADLHGRLYPIIRAFIGSRVGSSEDAQDLAQDVFVELHRDNGWYGQVENPEAYVLGIARKLISQYYQKRATSIRTIPIEEIGPAAVSHKKRQLPDAASRVQVLEHGRAIERVLSELSPKAREAFRLRFIDGLSTVEAAKKSGCSLGTFRKRLYRTLKSIRMRLPL